jgi:hypothetical protein
MALKATLTSTSVYLVSSNLYKASRLVGDRTFANSTRTHSRAVVRRHNLRGTNPVPLIPTRMLRDL